MLKKSKNTKAIVIVRNTVFKIKPPVILFFTHSLLFNKNLFLAEVYANVGSGYCLSESGERTVRTKVEFLSKLRKLAGIFALLGNEGKTIECSIRYGGESKNGRRMC